MFFSSFSAWDRFSSSLAKYGVDVTSTERSKPKPWFKSSVEIKQEDVVNLVGEERNQRR
jgi:hypothetical protein